MRFWLLCSYVALLCSSALAAEPERFTQLFDGKTFDGWEGNLDVFRIEDGAVVGGSLKRPAARNEFLCTKKAYGSFELRLKFKLLGETANGGVQIRSRRIPDHHEMIGYQADMGKEWWGCLYDESRRNRVLAGPPPAERTRIVRDGDWNDYVIRCEGRRIQLWVNGRQTVDYTEADASVPQTGMIGLQIHSGPPSEAWYKDVRIRELPSSEAQTPPSQQAARNQSTSAAFAADAPPPPKWLMDITRVAYTDMPNGRKHSDWPDKVIPDFAAAGVQMMFSRVHNGAEAPGLWWRSRHGESDPGMGERDGTREVVELAHKHGIRYLAYYWAQKEPAALAEAHPEWQMRNPGGQPIGYFCMNTRYRDLVRDRIVELVKDYSVDGIFFDMFHAVDNGCYCDVCKAKFKSECGAEPPTKEDFGNPLWPRWVTFKHRTIESALLDFNWALKAANPEAALVANSWNAWVVRTGNIRNSIRLAECVDGLLEETGWYDTVDPSFFAFPVLHNYMSWHLAGLCKGKRPFMWSAPSLAGWLPNDLTECTIYVMTAMTNGSVPAQVVPGRDVLRQYMPEIARFDEVVKEAKPEPWCGLVVSEPSELWYGREDPKGRYLKGVYGAFQAMLERHLPVSLVTDRDLALGRLDGLKVLLMPNCAALSENEMNAVREFVRHGGGLVATYETSRYDEWGNARERFGLADLLHVTKKGDYDSRVLFRDHDPKNQHVANFYFDPKHRWSADPVIGRTLNRRQPNRSVTALGRSVPVHCWSLLVEPDGAPPSPLRLRTADYNRQTQHVDRTDSPAVIESTFGKGKVIYFPSDLTWSIFRTGHEYLGRILELALRDAAAEPPEVEVIAPTIVQSMVYRQPNRLVVHLLNDISSLGRSQNVAGESLHLRREVIPLTDLKVTFRDPGWNRFRLIPGESLKAIRTESGWQVTVPRLDIHAAVVAER